jgi:hypothetical protein|tara:strand:+ start:20728 stop:21585 length:858 start_codon:yes stop_codon:yes gene_type:complete
MADIFDRKEEVLDIVLTKKGRELMSANKFKPTFYEFYDSDIVYDANNNETQNISSGRIKEGLYQKSTVSLFSKASTPSQLLTETGDTELPSMNLKNPIGSYEIGTQNAPAWSIQFYEGEYLTSADVFSTSEAEIVTTDMNNVAISSASLNGVNTNEERIPQFYVNVKYKLYQLQQKIKDGGTITNLYFDKGNQDLLLSIEEANVFSSGESPEFEVEIYEVGDTDGNVTKNKSLKRLYFDKEDFEDLDSVENYLNVLFDEEARFESNFKEISIYNALQEKDGEECQ